MPISDNIKELRALHKLSQAELGKIAGVSDKAVSTWENGEKIPRMGAIQKIADYFGISKSDIIEDKPRESSNVSEIITNGIYNIPVFESVAAGFGAYACSDICDYIPIVINNAYDVENFIAIKVKGDSMYPKIEDGDTIVVRKQDSVDSHSIAVIMLDSEEAVVKKIVYGEDWIELRSINPEYQTRRFEGEDALQLRVVGLVKQVIKNL